MKFFPGISLVVVATALLTFAIVALSIAPPKSLDGRDLFMLVMLVAGLAIGGLGIKDIRRVKRLAHG
jgi:hypothetical protein